MDFRDLIESINYDILEQTKFGLSSTVYPLGEKNSQFSEDVLEYFSESEVSIRYDSSTYKLHINWQAPN